MEKLEVKVKDMVPVTSDNTTGEYTNVYSFLGGNGNTDYSVNDVKSGNILCEIHFQSKPVSEGVDGIFNEDLLLIVKKRLEKFQEGKFACESNVEAIKAIDEALAALRRRTNDRKERNVLGTYEV